MATCIAAYGADVKITNPVGLKPVEIETLLGSSSPEEWFPKALVTDEGVVQEANMVALAMTAVAIASEVMAHKLAYDEYRLAKREADLATDVWNRYRSTYIPAEKKLAAYFRTKHPLAVAASNLRADYLQFVTDSLALSEAQFGRYRSCPPPKYVQDIVWAQNLLEIDVKNLMGDAEQERKRDMWITWFNRRSTFLNLGQDILSTSSAYIQSSMGLLSENKNTFMNVAQGAGYMAGYLNMSDKIEARRTVNYETPTNAGRGVISPAGAVGAVVSAGMTAAVPDITPEVTRAYGLDSGYNNHTKYSINETASIDAGISGGGY